MNEYRKNLPERAEVSASESAIRETEARSGQQPVLVNLTDIAVCIQMRRLALRATRWHRACIMGRPGESA
jgi:hypothetical protein